MSVLTAESLSKKYGDRFVLKDISLEIKSGEIIGLLGPNGAGKTTTFYMIAGLIKSCIGHIFLDGKDIGTLPLHARARLGISYLPQEPSIFRQLSVYNNLMSVVQTNKALSTKQCKDKVYDLMERFGISRISSSLGHTVSGGERRRVEIARALAIQPKFILMDEPFSGIDPISINGIKDIIRDLSNQNLGVLITDHNVKDTLSVCKRAYIVDRGIVIEHGKPGKIITNKQVQEVYLGGNFQI